MQFKQVIGWTIIGVGVSLCTYKITFNIESTAGLLKVINTTNQPIYLTPYYVPKFAPLAIQAQDPMELAPQKSAYIQRPDFRLGYDRYLLFNYDKTFLEHTIKQNDFLQMRPKYIGAFGGGQVYVADIQGSLRGYNTFEWNFWYPIFFGKTVGKATKYLAAQGAKYFKRPLQTIRASLSKALEQQLRFRLSYFWDTPYRDRVAHVRVSNELSEGEKRALAQRRLVAAVQLDKKFGTAAYIPKIAFLSSGGGYRAMFLMLGFLAAAQRIELLDLITWIGTVSGSSWGIGTLLTYAQRQQKNVIIADFNESLARALHNKKLIPNFKEIQAINNVLLVQALEHQTFTTVDLFGALLANHLFYFVPMQERQQLYLSSQAKLVESGTWPIPIYTAVYYDRSLPPEQYPWIECTPWEIGGTWLSSYAPIWSTGRQFNNGISQDYHLEKSLGFLFGTFGSAFAEQVSKIYEQFKDKLTGIINKVVESVIIEQMGERRLWWAQFYNFSKGIAASPIKDEEYLDLIDAYFACNVPYAPFSGERTGRTPDILIIFDDSVAQDGLVLSLIKRYAVRHNLKLPRISLGHLPKRAITVFKDIQDPSVPVIIYMPRTIDQTLLPKLQEPVFQPYASWFQNFDLEQCVRSGTCVVFNFTYPYYDIMRLMKIAEFNLLATQDIIFNEIKEVIDRKTALRES